MNQALAHSDVIGSPARRRYVVAWLFALAAMVFAMVVLGGVTRLTHSGLSMVEWKPVTGWFPPLSAEEWQRTFDSYKAYPEYQKINQGMTLEEFKGIFWLEFLHRLFGRILGLAFILPFLFFHFRGWLSRMLSWRLCFIFVLGGAQGVLGWYMVKSGLVDRPDVSQYRLAAHLSLALVIFAMLIWQALSVGRPAADSAPPLAGKGLRLGAKGILGLVFVTAFSGALVAGLDAGLIYNTFPLMDGRLIPEGYSKLTPFYLNLFENIAAVQFDHRVLAVTSVAAILIYWWAVRTAVVSRELSAAANALTAVALAQVGLGISTLLLVVPLSLAALHQAGAVVLLGTAVWVVFETAAPQRD